MPSTLLQSLVDHIAQHPNLEVGFVFNLALITSAETHSLPLNIKLRVRSILGSLTVSRLSPSFAPSLVELHCSGKMIEDDFLRAIASSPAAPTLRSLVIPSSDITDGSSTAWQHFKSLEVIDINNCLYITFKTLQAVSLLPSLKKMDISAPGNDCVLSIDQMDELLAEDRLKEMGWLHVSTLDATVTMDNIERIQQILRRHPTLTYVDLGASMEDPELELLLLQALPNVTRTVILAWSENVEDTQFLRHCSNFTEMVINDTSCFDKREDLEDLARFCPRLQSLTFRSLLADVGDDLSIFSCVKKLAIACHYARKICQWPSNLKELHIEGSMVSDEEPIEFIESICRLTSLTSLSIARVSKISSMSLSKLTSSLTLLRSLTLKDFSPDPNAEPTQLHSLPFLTSLSLPGAVQPLCDLSAVYLPSATTNSVPPWASCTVEQLPNCQHVVFSRDISVKEAEDALNFLDRFSGQLRTVVNSRSPFVDPTRYLKMQNLEKLHLGDSTSDLILAELLKSLPRLRHLNVLLSTRLNFSNFDWLTHDKIENLTIRTYHDGNPVAVVPALRIGGNAFPNLGMVDLALNLFQVAQLHFSGLPLAYSISARCGASSLDLAIEGCPYLDNVLIASALLNSIRLVDLDRLSAISFLRCTIPQNDAQTIQGVPRLKTATSIEGTGSAFMGGFSLSPK
jgi:hypothetical protein